VWCDIFLVKNQGRVIMRLFIPLLITFLWSVSSWCGVFNVTIPAPEYQIVDGRISAEECSYLSEPGAPKIPCRKVTIALPPGAVVENISFSGSRIDAGKCNIAPSEPSVPLTEHSAMKSIYQHYEKKKSESYNSYNLYPATFGVLLLRGGIRKYTVVDIACYHFAYNAVSERLYLSPNIDVTVRYRMPEINSRRANFWEKMKNDVTFDRIAEKKIYNWEDAKAWYRTDTPERANGYYIIIPSALAGSVDSLVSYRQSQGYDVQVVTREYIDVHFPGNDIQQKIRNYLRNNMSSVEYVLLVGFSSDMPWRQMVPFNNDPDSPWNDYNISPIPSDLYYAELTDPDSLSWNSDGDDYYGEVYDENGQPNGEDDPDYHADIHLGRIPFSDAGYIEDICEKEIAFDGNTNLSYKTASLLPGAVYYYANENGGGNDRNDGADYLEELMDDSVLDRSNAVYLYEKGGLAPCSYSCTDSLTQNNMISYWQSKGIMYECHHGNTNVYARKLWVWDDGDGIPENNEITWPTCLYINDVYQLDNNNPATSFLRSCLCGKPEVNSIGAMLLYRGASSVISSSRISWMTFDDPGGIPYHFYDRLMRDTLTSSGVIGNAYDLARTDFMDISMFWLPTYHYNLFGDPALRQYGRLAGIEEELMDRRHKTRDIRLTAYPNPFTDKVEINLGMYDVGCKMYETSLNIYDATGRLIKSIPLTTNHLSLGIDLSPGIYFLKVDGKYIEKIVKVR
jgi:hypothetical protein